MKDTGASPTNRPNPRTDVLFDCAAGLPRTTHTHASTGASAAPTHEFLVASFFAPAGAAPAGAPQRMDPRSRSVRRKLLTGDFP